ncbi:hypothetical protein PoMZ_13252, partial [Pyricularia oryzae]
NQVYKVQVVFVNQIHNPGDRRAASGTSLVHGGSIDYFNLTD